MKLTVSAARSVGEEKGAILFDRLRRPPIPSVPSLPKLTRHAERAQKEGHKRAKTDKKNNPVSNLLV